MNIHLALVLAGALITLIAGTRLAVTWPNATAARTASAGYGTAPEATVGAVLAALTGVTVCGAGIYLLTSS